MKVKETIAFIGEVDEQVDAAITGLVKAGYPLLLINKPGSPSAQIQEKFPAADIEMIDCEKAACWEADIILLAKMLSSDKILLEKIRTVATQKILVRVASPASEHTYLKQEMKRLKQELPDTKVVMAIFNEESPAVDVLGDDQEAVDRLGNIFSNAGYLTDMRIYPAQNKF